MNKNMNNSKRNHIFDIVEPNNGKVIPMNENTQIANNRGTRGSVGIVFLLVIGLLILGYALVQWGIPKSAPTTIKISEHPVETETEVPQYDNRLLRQQIEMLTNGYQADCSRIVTQYMNLLESNVDSDFSQARNSIPRVVDDLSGFGACVKLSYKAAKDRLKDTNDFQEAYMEVIDGPIVQPSLRAHRTANEMLQMLDQRLKERYAQYSVDLAAACGRGVQESQIPASDLARLEECISNVAAYAQRYQAQKLMTAVGVAVEAIFIRQTCSAIVTLFAKPVAKICGSLGAGAICAAADGPIPIGDIVGGVLAIGGFAWTAYDVYEVMSVMPKRLESELRDGINETKDHLLSDSRTQANEILQTYQNSGNVLKAQLVRELN